LNQIRQAKMPMMRRFLLIFFITFAAAATSPARSDEFEAGLSAFNAGDYAVAFAHWWPLAQHGDAKAQASLGFLYYSGKGVHRDDQKSLLWFSRAADAGQPTAQFFLGLQYFYGRGVRRDLAQAYSWCDIALANGYPESLFCRDAVSLEMSAEDMRRSTALTSEFLRTHEFRN
jgi:TPR repeat protein